jgi:hypothetical protein
MFLGAIRGQMSAEQQEKWLPLALSHRILGTYAQTELGHGSNVRGLETTATFDRAADEFVLQTGANEQAAAASTTCGSLGTNSACGTTGSAVAQGDTFILHCH